MKLHSPLGPKADDHRKHDAGIEKDIARVGIAHGTSEIVGRFGSAGAEHIKAYTGIDNETGKKLAKGLRDIAKGKLHPDYTEANLKQQAGFSAEVAATSLDNAEAIIRKSPERTVRSDDLPHYGKNHNVVDRVKVLNGEIIEGTQTQMKFVGNRTHLFERITREDGEFARYRGTKLELPSEQFEGAQQFCQDKAKELRQQAETVAQRGKPDIAAKLQLEADNYDQLATDVRDSGLTTENALFYRNHPKIATMRDIGSTSHRAGVEGARIGAAIGGCITILQNAFAVAQEKKQIGEALKELAQDTTKAAAIGYGTAFTGSALKGVMQQSRHLGIRNLAGTTAPALAVNICLSLGSSIKRYVNSEITEVQLLAEVGEKGAGMLSSSIMAALDQIAIPVPILGAAIGGLVGYTLSSLFYQSALESAVAVEASRERLAHVQQIETEARQQIATQRAALDQFTSREIPALHQETLQLFAAIDAKNGDTDAFAAAINQFTGLLGVQLQFISVEEFDVFMNTDTPLKL